MSHLSSLHTAFSRVSVVVAWMAIRAGVPAASAVLPEPLSIALLASEIRRIVPARPNVGQRGLWR
jgi:hypothetical protein